MIEELLPFCECGCGKRVSKIGNRFILGHNGRKTLWAPKPEALPCECGCGELAKPGNRFINGHSMKSKSHSPAHCAAMSKARRNSKAVKAKNEAQIGVPHTPERCAAISKGHAESDIMRGGNDLVTHHYIYDHGDMSLNTVQMTRSDHARLHMLLKKLNYIVPHINIKEV